jgi:hypothetical protein
MGWFERGYSIIPSEDGDINLGQVYHNTKQIVVFKGTLQECSDVLKELNKHKK